MRLRSWQTTFQSLAHLEQFGSQKSIVNYLSIFLHVSCIVLNNFLRSYFTEAHPLHFKKKIAIDIWPDFHLKVEDITKQKSGLRCLTRVPAEGASSLRCQA